MVLVDFFFVAPRLSNAVASEPESVNIAGMTTVVVSTWLAHYGLDDVITVEFFTSLGGALLLYPLLRLTVFRPAVSS